MKYSRFDMPFDYIHWGKLVSLFLSLSTGVVSSHRFLYVEFCILYVNESNGTEE